MVLLQCHLENLAFFLAFDLTFLPSAAGAIQEPCQAPLGVLFSTFGPVQPSATSNFSTRFREERLDLSATPTSLPSLLLSILAAGWSPYLCFTDTVTMFENLKM